ncbi:guanosine-3',5'-bis(diphosphate) 3'-pyrophosphohydrolase [Candidatus Kinetoplastibacterium desouzaii TCC079E]|uniref:Guanosine-3',5'-bis(Diphosphate) 3'-pyrophosphohydrolase n=1 Tax=Candidatus Kinetoplastidibacterium desouzai TCC079E TaxID=1208919 RepID=M1LU67_9PROT|nr:RelA/SpoT family protein [Candidatus Kinetoplastibacterium desouzaii]AGF46834.1 guanosine-3',5'-bis(diphosphate) 3'-pyrophosphohydrolase [Candidatus Kinetoplastibacterium desouzaii TCC079E]
MLHILNQAILFRHTENSSESNIYDQLKLIKEKRFLNILDKIHQHLTKKDYDLVIKAFLFAYKAHYHKKRDSGEPYISHPIAVAEICANWKLDSEAISAALLHDVIEDEGISKKELEEKFGSEVAKLVDGLSKIDRLEFETKIEQQVASLRKMLLATAKDIRVILIKLADRLHNMRTLNALNSQKRKRISRETIDIYAPIANRLGLNIIFKELQNLCFISIYPNRYKIINRAINSSKENKRELIDRINKDISNALFLSRIKTTIKYDNEKTTFGIYSKMLEQKKIFSEIINIYNVTLIVKKTSECYLALGAIHQLYKPIPGKFKDYISIPKFNGYQSLHTTLIGPYGTTIKFRICTIEMNNIAENGVANRWITYKNNKKESLISSQKRFQSLLDINNKTVNYIDFLEYIKTDLFPDDVYVLTPKGKIISLPKGAITIDFAYAISTEIGNKAISAKIHGEYISLYTKLNSGDKIEIITDNNSSPNIQWIKHVKSGKALSEIRHYLHTIKFKDSIKFGEKLLNRFLQKCGVGIPDKNSKIWEKIIINNNNKSLNELLADIGLGKKTPNIVAQQILSDNEIISSTALAINDIMLIQNSNIIISGKEGTSVNLASCCNPLPGDIIIAGIRPGQGIIVHTFNCKKAITQRNNANEKWINASWDTKTSDHLKANISVIINNDIGILNKLVSEITKAKSNIIQVNMYNDSESTASLQMTLQVKSRDHLAKIIKSIRCIPKVKKIIIREKNQNNYINSYKN